MQTQFSAVDAANQLTIQRLLLNYLSDHKQTMWTLNDVCVTARRISNRTGIPADATTFSYLVQNHDAAWSFRVRAVWRCGDLLRPWATHCVIEQLFDDDGRYAGDQEVAVAVHQWLQSLPL